MNPQCKKRVAFITSGCRANQYDSAAMENLIQQCGFEIVEPDQPADYYIINSCAVTAKAVADARRFAQKVQKINPHAITIVTGCAANTDAEEFEKIKGVEFVVGNQGKEKISELLLVDCGSQIAIRRSQIAAREQRIANSEQRTAIFFHGGLLLPKHTRSFLKIQDGCNQYCSYCIVPYARGKNRSVSPERVMQSIYELSEKGVQEVVLTGIHLGTYGQDLKPKTSLYNLLARIEKERPILRVRLSSIDPEEVSDELIELLEGSRLFCHHLHLPLQSGDDEILKRMKRRYCSQFFLDLTHQLKKRIPDLCIGTDVIVGFPGEDEVAFQNTCSLLEESPVSYIHVFPYSIRKGTKAASLKGQVLLQEKKRRSKKIRDLSVKKRQAFEESFHNRLFEVVLENRRGKLYGLTTNYISVELQKPEVLESNHLTHVRIDSVDCQRIHGKIVSSGV